MRAFELLGSVEDETRLLREPTTGYTVALPGHPQLVPLPAALPRYDAVVHLRDVSIELGFRIDDVPTTNMDPETLALAFAIAYAKNRMAIGAPSPNGAKLPAELRPPSTVAGAQTLYQLRETDADPVMEQLVILIHPAPNGVWALHHTTRFRTAALDVFEWSHVRGAIFDQHYWDPEYPLDRPSPIWPPDSEIAIPSAKLELTPAGWREAAAKGARIGRLGEAQGRALVQQLMAMARTNDPPRNRIHPMLIPTYIQRIAPIGPSHATDAMLHNLDRCLTTLDLRAWAWQCTWAIARQDRLAARAL